MLEHLKNAEIAIENSNSEEEKEIRERIEENLFNFE